MADRRTGRHTYTQRQSGIRDTSVRFGIQTHTHRQASSHMYILTDRLINVPAGRQADRQVGK